MRTCTSFSRRFWACGAVAWCAALSACGPDSAASRSGASGVTVRDSAGIRIVENQDSAWTEATRWRLAEEPDLRIGSLDGSVPGTDWGESVEVRSAGDRLVVFDMMTSTVRVFDAVGRHERTVELLGEGPNEIRDMAKQTTLGDEAAVWSYFDERILRVGLSDGDVTASRTVGREWEGLSGLMVVGWLDDGSYVMANTVNPAELEPGRRVVAAEHHLFSADGSHEGLVAELPTTELWKEEGAIAGSVAFAPQGRARAHRDALWHSYPAGQAELTRYVVDTGAVDRSVRLPLYSEPVKPEWVARSRRQLQEQMQPMLDDPNFPASAKQRMQRQMEAQQFADSTASLGEFEVATDGSIWIVPSDGELIERQMSTPEGTDMVAWYEEFLETYEQPYLVVDSAGRWLGTLTLPPTFVVSEFGEDYLLGTREDEMGVPFVERYPIIRP